MQDHSFTVRYCAWMIIIDIVPLRECGNDHAPFCFAVMNDLSEKTEKSFAKNKESYSLKTGVSLITMM